MSAGASRAAPASQRRGWPLPAVTVALALTAGLLAGCGTEPPLASRPLQLWSHGGTPAEVAALERAVRAFETAHPGQDVVVTAVTEGDYNDRVQAAIAAGELPDVIDVDGPMVATWAAQDALHPLDGLLSEAALDAQLPSLVAQSSWRDHRWVVGAFDSGLGLFADRAALRAAGVRVPTGVDDGWSADEFDAVLAALASRDGDGKVLDLKLHYGAGEWLTYGFAPLVSSAGGAMLDDDGRARGSLDAAPALHALTRLGRWSRYADRSGDDAALAGRRVALAWVGHWAYGDLAEALAEDLVLLPLPDLGAGSRSGQGSWAWGVGSHTEMPRQAAELVEFLVADSQVLDMTAANGAVPGTLTALARSPLHGVGGPLHLYAEQLSRTCGAPAADDRCVTVPRPVSTAYPTVTTAFALAVRAVLDGGAPEAALARAARTVDGG